MLAQLICPDGQLILIQDCFNACRLGRRCLTLPTLKAVTSERPFNGVFSTTQLLNGTMYEYLRLTRDYAIVPQRMAFALHGTQHHSYLEAQVSDELAEQRFHDDVNSGMLDIVEREGDHFVLTDYKTWGSFKTALFLGLTAELIDDPSGDTYQRTTTVMGMKFAKGHPKQVKLWHPDPMKADAFDVEMQLNDYRIKAERAGINPIERLQVQITVRDGGLQAASQRGIDFLMQCFDVQRLEDDEVIAYFTGKAEQLREALKSGWDEPCSDRECWQKDKCRNYCDLWQECPQGIEVRLGGDTGE